MPGLTNCCRLTGWIDVDSQIEQQILVQGNDMTLYRHLQVSKGKIGCILQVIHRSPLSTGFRVGLQKGLNPFAANAARIREFKGILICRRCFPKACSRLLECIFKGGAHKPNPASRSVVPFARVTMSKNELVDFRCDQPSCPIGREKPAPTNKTRLTNLEASTELLS